MQKKLIIILSSLIAILLIIGITYSIFRSSALVVPVDQNIAKFVFNAQSQDNISLPIIDYKPGDKNDYLFSISNNENGETSEVTIEYQIVLKTFHLSPLAIKLYKIENDQETLVLECDESYSRNDHNEIVCNLPIQTMTYTEELFDNYKLEIEFPSLYNDQTYSELVDYINLDIRSWQKL